MIQKKVWCDLGHVRLHKDRMYTKVYKHNYAESIGTARWSLKSSAYTELLHMQDIYYTSWVYAQMCEPKFLCDSIDL